VDQLTVEALLLHAENGNVSTTMNQLEVSEVPNPGNDGECRQTAKCSFPVQYRELPAHRQMQP
jgi:hypothetical protein